MTYTIVPQMIKSWFTDLRGHNNKTHLKLHKPIQISLVYCFRRHNLSFFFSVKRTKSPRVETNAKIVNTFDCKLLRSMHQQQNILLFQFHLEIALIQFYKKHHLLRLCPNSPCKHRQQN